VRLKVALVVIAALLGDTSAAVGQKRGLPGPVPQPTVYTAPTPAPVPPPVNPGPATVPPAGLSPLLTEPGPVSPTPQKAMPAYPPPQLPGPVGQQNTRAYRNNLLGQQWHLERNGVSPDSERSREIQQQLNQPSSR
jgi:hypothetical protein